MLPELTHHVHKLIVRLVGNGNYLDVAAAAAGVSEHAVKEWLSRGKLDGEEPYASFYVDVMAAEATKEDELLGRVEEAGKDPEFWQASAWILARRFPKRWQEKVQIELANELERMLALLEQRLAPEIYTQVLEALSDSTSRPVKRPLVEAKNTGPRALAARVTPTE